MALSNRKLGNPQAEERQMMVSSSLKMRVFMSPGSRFTQGKRYSRRVKGMPTIDQAMMGKDGNPNQGPKQASNGRGSDATVRKVGL